MPTSNLPSETLDHFDMLCAYVAKHPFGLPIMRGHILTQDYHEDAAHYRALQWSALVYIRHAPGGEAFLLPTRQGRDLWADRRTASCHHDRETADHEYVFTWDSTYTPNASSIY